MFSIYLAFTRLLSKPSQNRLRLKTELQSKTLASNQVKNFIVLPNKFSMPLISDIQTKV